MTIFDLIVFVIIFGTVAYFAYRSGFEEGQSAANRRHTQQLSRLRNENGILDKRTVDLYERIYEIEKRLSRRVVVKGTMPDGAADCAFVYDHDPSGQMVGTVVETENTEDGVRASIRMADNAVKNQWETIKVMNSNEYLGRNENGRSS